MSLGTRDRLEYVARIGYTAHGLVNLVIGLLALLGAVGWGGSATGSKGALQTLLAQPLGYGILAITGLGLFCFAFWRLCQSLLDADGRGKDTKALLARAGQFVSAIIYAGLGVFAVSLLIGWSAGGSDEQAPRDWTAWLLAKPFGRWLVGAAGLAVAGAAFGMAARAFRASFRKHLSCGQAAAAWVVPLGRAGYAARAVVMLTVGIFLVIAAYQSDASEARGLGGALVALRDQPFGPALYIIVAIGLAAFGAFEFAEARYRRIDAPDGHEMLRAAKAPMR